VCGLSVCLLSVLSMKYDAFFAVSMASVEGPSCSCYPSLLITMHSDAPGGKVFKILTVIMLFVIMLCTASRNRCLHQAQHYVLHVMASD